MTTLQTWQLVPGMRVELPLGHVRTVERVELTGETNYRNEPLYAVTYAEGSTAEWSGGNSGCARTAWQVLA